MKTLAAMWITSGRNFENQIYFGGIKKPTAPFSGTAGFLHKGVVKSISLNNGTFF